MRSYEFVATEATYDALRRLRAPWVGYTVAPEALRVRLEDGTVVRVGVIVQPLEAEFEAVRIEAEVERSGAPGRDDATAGLETGFRAGRNDIVVFRGETWLEAPDAVEVEGAGAGAALVFSGRPGTRSATAVAVCTTTDAVLVASTSGTGILVQPALVPRQVEVTEDRVAIARFLAQRGYTG